jgi:DNA-binding beta-propeller fold protein YncE
MKRSSRQTARSYGWQFGAMVIFRPDGAVAFVNSSRTAELDVVDVKTPAVIKKITGLVSPFSPNLAASPDGGEVCLTHKDVGKVTIVDAQSFAVLWVIDTGPTTNHVNFVSRPDVDYA